MGSAAGLPGVRNPGDHSCSRGRNRGSAQLSSLNAIVPGQEKRSPSCRRGGREQPGAGWTGGVAPKEWDSLLFYWVENKTHLLWPTFHSQLEPEESFLYCHYF